MLLFGPPGSSWLCKPSDESTSLAWSRLIPLKSGTLTREWWSTKIPIRIARHKGTVVRYAVSVASSVVESGASQGVSSGTASIYSPTDNGEANLTRAPDGVYKFEVDGIVSMDTSKSELLLWVQPINPPSNLSGWYLQRAKGFGVVSLVGGRWRGICQLGNSDYPPRDGHTAQVVATVVPIDEAKTLRASDDLTTVELPGSASATVQFTVRIR